MFEVKAREGDFVETSEGLFFDVKGLVHPPDRIIAFIRYFPDEEGERKKNRRAYGQVYSFSERYELLKRKYPKYVVHDAVFDETLCEVLEHDIRKHYDPVEGLSRLRARKDLDSLENKTLQLVEKLQERSEISWSAIGISGSILVGLKKHGSDIDPIVYGSNNCRRAYLCLQELLKEPRSLFKAYSLDELKSLFDFRSKDTTMGFQDFVRTESKKAFQGKFMETDYFIRFVKNWNEIHEEYGDVRYRNMGHATIKATVTDDSDSIFTPCRYAIENVEVVDGPSVSSIKEIASFRGRFCDQARNGDNIIARGKVESVTDLKRSVSYFRLLIGNMPSDYMILR
jgi:predicted nucleotidyltransferase